MKDPDFVSYSNFLHYKHVKLLKSLTAHSEKFIMNRNGNSILSEKICNFFLV